MSSELGERARVIVVRPGIMAFAVSFGIEVNGVDVGSIRSHDFVQADVPSGEVKVVARAETTCTATFPVEAGHTYYVEAEPRMGWWYARVQLEILDPVTGAEAHLECTDQTRR